MERVDPFPGFPLKRYYDSHFHALARSIIYQQLAGNAAASIHGKVSALTPGSAFPTPEEFLEMSEAQLRGAGLSRAKMKSILDLSRKVVDGDIRLRSVARRPNDEVIAELTSVWGIGEWTAQMFLMFRLGRLDIMPAGDLGVQEGVRRLDRLEERPTPGEVKARAEVWAPLRSVAAWTLYRVADE
jgi:3-methyladenine DNA glycosylase/8-oxoguanine DNA glycosylase